MVEWIADHFGGRTFGRQGFELCFKPQAQVFHQRPAEFLPRGESLCRVLAADFGLDAIGGGRLKDFRRIATRYDVSLR